MATILAASWRIQVEPEARVAVTPRDLTQGAEDFARRLITPGLLRYGIFDHIVMA
jgi:hypothetical protein